MAFSFILADPWIIIINSELSILTSNDKVISLVSDCNWIQLAFRAFQWPDDLTIIFLPISDLPIAAGSENMVLFRVEDCLLEGGRLEQAQNSGMWFDIPDDSGAIPTRTHSLCVFFVDLNWPDPSPVLLHAGFHSLCLFGDPPNSDFSFCSPWNYSLSIDGWSHACAAMIMCIVYYI